MIRKFFLIFIILSFAILSSCSVLPGGQPDSTVSPSAPPPMPAVSEAPSESPAQQNVPQQEIPEYNSYNVTMEVEPITRMVRGIESISFTNRAGVPLSSVVVRTYLNAFSRGVDFLPYFPAMTDRVFINGEDYGYMNILHVSFENNELEFNHEGTVLTVTLPQPLAPGQTTQLRLQFEAYVPQIAGRTGANKSAMWCGMFLPVLAAYGEDGWRTEPYYPAGDPFVPDTANYTVGITLPEGYVVAGSGVQKEDVLDGKKVTTFSAKLARDFAFAVSNKYKVAETVTNSGVAVQFYYYTETMNVDGVLNAAAQSMNFFETYVGAYPYKNLCVIETDMFVSGMEFAKIVFMDSERLQESADYRDLTHEIGHQWFYNVVGSDQIKEAWLDEGLTSYIQARFGAESEEAFRENMDAEYKSFEPKRDQVLANGVDSYKDWATYYTVNYYKAKLMFYALERLLGNENFKTVIQKYYQAFSFRVAKSEDFIAIAEEVYGESLQVFFNNWLKGSGLPRLPEWR